MRHFDFTPLNRSAIGFDRLAHFFNEAQRAEAAPSYPPYNIELVAVNRGEIGQRAGIDNRRGIITGHMHRRAIFIGAIKLGNRNLACRRAHGIDRRNHFTVGLVLTQIAKLGSIISAPARAYD